MPKPFLFTVLLILLSFLSFGQVKDSKTDDVVLKYKKAADRHFERKEFNIALKQYARIVQPYINDPDFNFKYGRCILEAYYYKETAIPFFETAASAGNVEAIKFLGITYHEIYKFDDALKYYNKYISYSDTNSWAFKTSNIRKLIEYSLTAKELVENPVNVTIENLGPQVNSEFADYVPIVTADDQEIVFTSRRPSSTGGNKDENDEFFEDIFYAQRDSTGNWLHSRHISGDLNSHGHDAVAGLSADGQTLLLYQNDEFGLGGDLFMSILRDTVWTSPIKLSDEISRKDSWEPSASLTANEDAIYFSSDRPGGYGGLDIYISKRLPNGKYGEAKNLGPSINTKYDEDAPFISADSKTLYFSSKGHKNMGGYDVFKSEKEINGEWAKPENMGYPINTPDDDVFFTINAAGTHGYYSSLGVDSYGEKDIYQIKFTPKPKTLAVLKGKVTNMQNVPIAAQIFVTKTSTNKLNGLYNSNSSTGKYLIVLQPGFGYKAVFNAKGYYDDTLLINAKDFVGFNEVIKNIKLRKLAEKLPDSIKATTKEQLVIGAKDTIIPQTKKEILPIVGPKQVLVDTNGNQQEIAFTKNPPVDLEKSPSKTEQPLEIDFSDGGKPVEKSKRVFTKDCEIDFTNNIDVVTFNFGYKMNDLNEKQYRVLDSLVLPFKNKIVGVKINAHTDHIGSFKYNMLLSELRAKSIVDHLNKIGIHPKKIVACFYGESRPLIPNHNPDGTDNPEARYKNRRAEIDFYIKE